MSDLMVDDFKVGDRVYHVFHCKWATVTKVGRKLLHVQLHLDDSKHAWLPSSVRKDDAH